MIELSQVEALVLNECVDDAENLEQIYRQIALPSASTPCVTDLGRLITLTELADAVRSLVERRLLIVHHDPAKAPADDLSYVWRCWFEAGSQAREVHDQLNSVGLASP